MLFASLQLAFGLEPAQVILPEHIIVAWEATPDSGKWASRRVARGRANETMTAALQA